jgi:hypothetical protein
MEDLREKIYKEQCAIYDPIARLFNELSLKHNKREGEILLQYQDNTIFVFEQDYEELKVLEEITLRDITTTNKTSF